MVITTEEIRTAVSSWAKQRLLADKRLGESMVCLDITDSSAYRVTLRAEYETRSRGMVSVPAPKESRGNDAVEKARNESALATQAIQKVTQARQFVSASYRVFLDDSHQLQSCNHCGGQGNTRCTACGGMGSKVCPMCGGMGARMIMQPRTTFDAKGRPTTSAQTVRQPCMCMTGRVRCMFCSGIGTKRCDSCEGCGSVHQWSIVTHQFDAVENDSGVTVGELPANVLGEVHGAELCSCFLTVDSPIPALPATVQKAVHEMISRSEEPSAPGRQMLFKHLTVSGIPVHEVRYSTGGTRDARLWIYGIERKVHAPVETGLRGIWNRMTR
jgi:hypothetical protein